MYEIENGIPAPEVTRGAGRKYPFKEMEVGDSFFVDEGSAKKLQAMAYGYGKKLKAKFVARTYKTGARVWRVA